MQTLVQPMKYLVITRPEVDQEFSHRLEDLSLKLIHYPTIKITPTTLTVKQKQLLKNLQQFNWIVFTSKNGVRFFLKALTDLGISPDVLANQKLAAVGDETSHQLESYQLKATFIPSTFTTQSLGEKLPIKKDEKILLPRADLVTPKLAETLTDRGGDVTNLPIYHTRLGSRPDPEFEKLLLENRIAFITFTSSSTVKGFIKQLTNQQIKEAALKCEVLSIGPVTTHTLKMIGFTNIHTAKTHTMEGIFKMLQEIYT